jgi:hypothetical protein
VWRLHDGLGMLIADVLLRELIEVWSERRSGNVAGRKGLKGGQSVCCLGAYLPSLRYLGT